MATARLRGVDPEEVAAALYKALAEDPRPAGCRPVKVRGAGVHRLRVDDYRVIYLVLDDEQVVVVARVARRNESTYRA
jgi:mRNA-degrading endonuclease RelE of RelBE toxin-antitoxin system